MNRIEKWLARRHTRQEIRYHKDDDVNTILNVEAWGMGVDPTRHSREDIKNLENFAREERKKRTRARLRLVK